MKLRIIIVVTRHGSVDHEQQLRLTRLYRGPSNAAVIHTVPELLSSGNILHKIVSPEGDEVIKIINGSDAVDNVFHLT